MNDCCQYWAVTDHHAMNLGNGHNPTCPHYVPNVGAVQILTDLVAGIKFWASQEDGVPDEVWEAYKKAVFITEGRLLPDDQE